MSLSWFAARVMPNAELRVQKQLYQIECQALVPVEERRTVRAKRARDRNKANLWVKRQVPILPGYVFLGVYGDAHFAEARRLVNERVGANILYGRIGLAGRPAQLTEDDLQFLRTLGGLIESRRLTAMVRVGGTLKVVRGLYEGQIGPVLRIGGKDRSRVKSMMTMFGRMSVVELPMADVEAA